MFDCSNSKLNRVGEFSNLNQIDRESRLNKNHLQNYYQLTENTEYLKEIYTKSNRISIQTITAHLKVTTDIVQYINALKQSYGFDIQIRYIRHSVKR